MWISPDGVPYGGDRQFRQATGWDAKIPDPPASGYTWNGSIWVAPLPPPNWDGFFQSNFALIVSLLTQSPQPVVADFLQIEFSKRSDIDPERLMQYWNLAIAPNAEQITILKASAATHNLPVDLDAGGKMVQRSR